MEQGCCWCWHRGELHLSRCCHHKQQQGGLSCWSCQACSSGQKVQAPTSAQVG
jgi:hypothetical protein